MCSIYTLIYNQKIYTHTHTHIQCKNDLLSTFRRLPLLTVSNFNVRKGTAAAAPPSATTTITTTTNINPTTVAKAIAATQDY